MFSKRRLSTSLCVLGPDNRCFLETGGSAESFFVSEDLPVGSVVGTLRILGDPSERGNIDLRLKELDSPVRIAPGSKNLTLTRKLDKEKLKKNTPPRIFSTSETPRLLKSEHDFRFQESSLQQHQISDAACKRKVNWS
ncbi:hypothetical protein J6590_004753 [Homalodisca vitripennis]|nr:hypothetical protein J6590_004753 [Homalodisca vitripennis]